MKTLEPSDVDGPMRIYVGGLEHLADISENDLRAMFPFGDIDYIDLHKDDNTGKIKGYAFIQFRKGSHARVAIKEMNGFNYSGKILKVN
jgi:RNA-binding protein 39